MLGFSHIWNKNVTKPSRLWIPSKFCIPVRYWIKTSAFIWWHPFVWSYDKTVTMKRFISLPRHILIFSYSVVLRRAVVKWGSSLWLCMITNMSVSLIICITLKFLETMCVGASVRPCVLLFLPSYGLPAQQARFFLKVYLFIALCFWFVVFKNNQPKD